MSLDLTGKVVHNIRFNLSTSGYNVPTNTVMVKEVENNSHFLAISSYDSRGKINFTGNTAQLNALMPDGMRYKLGGRVIDGDIYVGLTDSMLSQVGTIACDVSVFGEYGEKDSLYITPTFYVIVKESAVGSIGNGIIREVDIDFSTGNQEVSLPPSGVASTIILKKPVTLLPENIKNGVNIGGVIGTFTGTAPIYGVSGMYQENPSLTRTDDAVGMSFAINSSSGAISSDFNDVFPWNEASVVTINGNKFLSMPEMYFRIGYDASQRITDVAVSKQARGIGNWYKVDPFYYSCYGGSVSNNKLCSVSGVERQASKTRAEFRAYAMANGSGYFQEDLYHRTVMMFLWYIEWATKNSESIMTGRIDGSGTSGGATVRPTGGTDSVTTPSGFETTYAQMRYHYIEDFVGNLREFVDGVVWNTNLYVSADPTAYSDSSEGLTESNLIRNPSGDCLAALGWDSANPFLCYGVETVTNYSCNTYYCDYHPITNSTSPVLYCGTHYVTANVIYGLSYYLRDRVSASYANIGGRLLYKP